VDTISEKKYLTVQEVAVMIGVKVKTVYFWTQTGLLPSHKIGRLIRIDRDDVVALMKKTRRGPQFGSGGTVEPQPDPGVTA
jgi:excisionase family DNA binding protein